MAQLFQGVKDTFLLSSICYNLEIFFTFYFCPCWFILFPYIGNMYQTTVLPRISEVSTAAVSLAIQVNFLYS